MEFQFNVNEYFKRPIVEIGNTLLPPDFVGDRRALWNTVNKVAEIVNEMGEASAHAQGLNKPITTAERLRQSDQNLYLLVDHGANNGNGAVTGMLKIGKKGLYVFDREGQHFQVTPPCVLDFYVHEKRQRSGLGRKLFEYMLENENVKPCNLAIDRPSEKFLNFLNKHYYLQNPIKQMNNYVVFDGFFPESQRKESVEMSPMNRTNGLQSTQSPNNQPLYGRYGAPRPPCSMGQIIHNTTAQKNSEPASPNNFKNTHGLMPNQVPLQGVSQNDNNNMQQCNYMNEQHQNLGHQYQNQNTGKNIIFEDTRRNITSNQPQNYQNTQQLNQFHQQQTPQMQQFDHQQPYPQDQIRMFPEKETQSRNEVFSGNGEVKPMGNTWPGQFQTQQFNEGHLPSSYPYKQDQQQFQTSMTRQQSGHNGQVGQPMNYQNENLNASDMQQHNMIQQYKIQNENIQQPMQNYSVLKHHTDQQHTQPIQYKDTLYPQQQAPNQPYIPGDHTVNYVTQQHEPNQSSPQQMPIEYQTRNDVYSTPLPHYSQTNSMGMQQQPTVSHYNVPGNNVNYSQQYVASQNQQAISHLQQIPQYQQAMQVERNLPATADYSRYHSSIEEQPPLVNNQQTCITRRSAPNVTRYINQPLPVQATYSSQPLSNYEQSRLKTQPYQHVHPGIRERRQPLQQIQEHSEDSKSQLKSDTVHSLLQVDPKYFKPNPIQLKQTSNMLRCPTPRNKKEETVASLLNAEQEFFENGLLRDEYRGVRRRTAYDECSSLHPLQEQDGYPKQIPVDQRASKQYIQQYTPPPVQTPQATHSGNIVPQSSRQNISQQETNHQVEQKINHPRQVESQQIFYDQVRSQQHHSPTIHRQVEYLSPPEQFGNQQQLHDQTRSQHQSIPLIPHPDGQKLFQQQVFRSDVPDRNNFTTTSPQMQPPHQYNIVTQGTPMHIPQIQPPQQYEVVTQGITTNSSQMQPSQQYDSTYNQNNQYQSSPIDTSQQLDHQQFRSTTNSSEKVSGDRHPYVTEGHGETPYQIPAGGQPQRYQPNIINNVQDVDKVSDKLQDHNKIEPMLISEESTGGAKYQEEPYQSPATIRQGSFISNDFHPHPEGQNKVSTDPKMKSSDEEIGSRRKDVSRQYGLNEVDMRRKGYKSTIIKRSTDLQEIDNLEFGYPPQVTKNVTMPTVVADSVHSSPKLERPKSLEIQTDILVPEPSIQPEVATVDEEDGLQDDVEPELEKLTIDEDLAAPLQVSDKDSGKRTPRHLTEQGYFDLKFYHNKLW